MADFNPDAWLANKTGPEGSEAFDPDQWLAKKGKTGILKALDTTGRVLDYGGGLARHVTGGGITAAVEALQGKPASDIVAENQADASRALVGKGPRWDEYLQRMGVPRGASTADYLPVKKGGMLDLSLRGTAGTAADIANDPLTWGAGALAEGIPVVGRAIKGALNPLTATAEGAQTAGRGLYNHAWNEADHAASMAGKELLPSQVGWEMGINGGGKAMARQTDDALANLMSQRDDLVKMVDQAGVEGDMTSALANVRQKIAGFRASRDPSKMRIANAMEPQINEIENVAGKKAAMPAQTVDSYAPSKLVDESGVPFQNKTTTEIPAVPRQPGVNLSQALSNKTSLYNQTGEAAYDTLTKTTPGQDLLMAASNGIKNESEKMASQARPGGGETLSDINERLGALLTPRDIIEKGATKEARRIPFTQVDSALLMADPKLYVAKQLGKAMGGSAFKTYGGRALYGAGSAASKVTPALDLLDRQFLINLGLKDD